MIVEHKGAGFRFIGPYLSNLVTKDSTHKIYGPSAGSCCNTEYNPVRFHWCISYKIKT